MLDTLLEARVATGYAGGGKDQGMLDTLLEAGDDEESGGGTSNDESDESGGLAIDGFAEAISGTCTNVAVASTAEEARAIADAGLPPDTTLFRSSVASGYTGVSRNPKGNRWRVATGGKSLGTFDTALLGAIAYAQAVAPSTVLRNEKHLVSGISAEEAITTARELGLTLQTPAGKRAETSKTGYVGVWKHATQPGYMAGVCEGGRVLYLRGIFQEPAEGALRRAQVLGGDTEWLVHSVSQSRLSTIAAAAGSTMLGGRLPPSARGTPSASGHVGNDEQREVALGLWRTLIDAIAGRRQSVELLPLAFATELTDARNGVPRGRW